MDAKYLPLILASTLVSSPGETEPLDRLRMQKAVFLLSRRGKETWAQAFLYRAYDWGPYSPDLSAAIRELSAEGLLEQRPYPGKRYPMYHTTAEGEAKVLQLAGEVDARTLDFVRATRRFVVTRSFSRLLRDVYAAYPEYAANSRFSG